MALFSSRVPLSQLASFCGRMGVGLKAGVDILRLLETDGKRGTTVHRRHLESIRNEVKAGESLASSFKKSGSYFPVLLIQMISAGESAGSLDRVFLHMSQHYLSLRDARRAFLAQISWPLIQLGIALGVVTLVIALRGLATPVSDEESFDPLGFGLAGTQGVIVFLGMVALLFAAITALVIAIWKNALQCHRWLMPWIIQLPIIGNVFRSQALSRMSMTLSMLLNAGVDARRAVRESYLSTRNDYYRQGMPKSLALVERGQSLANCFEAAGVFPREFIEGIEVGELSGSETESLESLATEYQRQANTALTQLSLAAGVAIWIGIALFIIFMIIRMVMQYVNMLNSFM
jgi:type IV pilus assembly protein PilC